MKSNEWFEVSKSKPCPICHKPDWCAISADGCVVKCMREDEGAFKTTDDCGHVHRLKESPDRSPPKRSPGRKAGTFSNPMDAARAVSRSLARSGELPGERVPDRHYGYQDKNREPVLCVLRWDTDSGKIIRPIHRQSSGEWGIGQLAKPWPIYRLPDVLETEDPVWVTEGEKAADALGALGLVATTSPHGAKSADSADWSSLAGKSVAVWPDNDKAGEDYARVVCGLLAKLNPHPTVRIVRPKGLPEKGDAADWCELRDAADPETLRRELQDLFDKAEEFPLVPEPSRTVASPINDLWLLGVDRDDPWPAPLAPAAFHGPAGDFVRLVGGQTESDEAALLFHFLAYFAAMVGRNCYRLVEAAHHYPQLFCAFVGQSSKGRKGTAQRNVERLFKLVDGPNGTFVEECVVSGLVSGEGLVYHVRDATTDDLGVSDKRLLVVESELANTLKVVRRETNTLSPTIRDAWDKGSLRTLAKNTPTRATGAHIIIVGHITREELRRLLTEVDQANGFANRFLWVCTKRSRLLPDGGRFPESQLHEIANKVRAAVQAASQPKQLGRTAAAGKLWYEIYGELAADRPGMLGHVTNRAEAQVLRLSLIYALLDQRDQIDEVHLRAALACWRYCEESAAYAFGRSLGDPVAQELLNLMRASTDGVSREQMRDAFHRNKSAADIRRALGVLERLGLAYRTKDTSTGGRPAEIWHAVRSPADAVRRDAESDLNAVSPTSGGDTAFPSFTAYPPPVDEPAQPDPEVERSVDIEQVNEAFD